MLRCVNRNCPARASVGVPKESGLITIKGTRSGGKHGREKNIYKFDYADPRARDLENYIFFPKNSAAHSNPPHSVTLLNPVKHDFRESHVNLGVQTGREEINTVLGVWDLTRTYGVQTEATVLGKRRNEQAAFYRKKWASEVSGELPVPDDFAYIYESDPRNGDFIGEATKTKFFQGQTENFTIFFLERELIYLETQTCCSDGTFHIVKNLNFHQLYIISATFRHLENVISVPIIFCFMKERKAVNYHEVFDFVRVKFAEIFHRPLSPRKIVLDCEMAPLKILKDFFPECRITLCRVHIIRNLRKKCIEIFGRPFFEGNKQMQIFWQICKGLFYVPPTTFETIKAFMRSTIRPQLTNHKNDYDKFMTYFTKFYLNFDAKFPPQLWSVYNSLADHEDFSCTSNPIEALNRVLKNKCPTGKINFRLATSIVHLFKVDALRKFHTAMWLEDMNPRKQSTVDREQKIKEIMKIFIEQGDLENPISLCNFAGKFAAYDETVSLFEEITQL